MTVILFVVLALVVSFCAVIAFGAPYLPTLSKKIDEALNLLDLKAGETMLELGCGDGRLLVAAAKRGIKSVGYELNPVLFVYTWIRTIRYRSLISVKYGNYWRADWPDVDGIYVFLLKSYMSKLHNRITRKYKNKSIKVVSFAFQIEEKKSEKEVYGMFLYKY